MITLDMLGAHHNPRAHLASCARWVSRRVRGISGGPDDNSSECDEMTHSMPIGQSVHCERADGKEDLKAT